MMENKKMKTYLYPAFDKSIINYTMSDLKSIFSSFIQQVESKVDIIAAIEQLKPKYTVKDYKLDEITPEKAYEHFSVIQ